VLRHSPATVSGFRHPRRLNDATVLDRFSGAHDPGLQDLFLNANIRLGDDGLTQLASALPPTLVKLAIGSTGCGDRGLAAVAAALSKLTRLERLDCGGNTAIGVEGWQALARALPRMAALQVWLVIESRWSQFASECQRL
jgi:hypothetical protein